MERLQIKAPEGYEIDLEKSDLQNGIVEFKQVKKKLTYVDIAEGLFKHENVWTTNISGKTCKLNKDKGIIYLDPNNAVFKEQLECLMAYNKLRNVAEYLNRGHDMKWNLRIIHYYHALAQDSNNVVIFKSICNQSSSVYFATKELAQQAIEILGEEEIKKALFIY